MRHLIEGDDYMDVLMNTSLRLHAEIGLAAHRAETRWPPTFPRPGTLLTPNDDPTIPRETWGAVEWKAYAMFLEEAGALIAQRLLVTQEMLSNIRSKLSRKRGNSAQSTLLAGEESRPKRKPAAILNLKPS